MGEKGVETVATVKLDKCTDLYKVVDVLNRTLKKKDLMFGLALDEKEKDKMIFTVYET